MKLETLAARTIRMHLNTPSTDPRMAAWIVWTMRNHWHADYFADTYIHACDAVNRASDGITNIKGP